MRRGFVVVGLLVLVLAPHRARADDPPEALYSCHATTGKVTVQFKPEVSIKDLASWLIGFSCKNVILGAGVATAPTAVTIIAPVAMTPKQAIQLWVDSVEAAGFVVVQKADTIIVKLGPNTPQRCGTTVGSDDTILAPPSRPSPQPPAPAPQVADELESLFDANIRKVDDTHIEITRALVDKILTNPMAVAKTARMVPAVANGKPAGFKLYAIRPNSLYARIGLTNGDTLVAVNGHAIDSADSALEAYTKVRTASTIELDVQRRGKTLRLMITIVTK
jgi:hypothetical protein